MDIAAALREARPGTSAAALGTHRVLRFRTQTPAHVFESVVEVIGGRLVELTARDSFDDILAEFMLDRMVGLELPGVESETILVLEAEFPAPWPFGALVIAPPAVAKRFEHESISLERITYWAFPAFLGEFTDGAGVAEFWHQIRRMDGWRSVVIRWNRERKSRPLFDA